MFNNKIMYEIVAYRIEYVPKSLASNKNYPQNMRNTSLTIFLHLLH